MDNNLAFKLIKPNESITDFVYGFSSIGNISMLDESVVTPNGRIDLHFYKTEDNQFHISPLAQASRL